MRMINRALVVAAAVSLAGITGCAGSGGGSYTTPPPASSAAAAPSADASAPAGEATITIRDFAYEVPASVKPGAMVTVTNADSAPHTVTAKDEGGFDVEVPAGGTVTFQAPDVPGEYAIICTFHPQMSGTLVVK
ncbi:cupredoxin domain-containing protein [Pseudarthrobacter sp. AL07]|uniref:cupredoxin domain-containing protein n=1 Tax=unclassified Pseudarthrobacter TaxID=2647000 RepID=UPI00249CA576|nr:MULTISPECIES: cupredoxin domain-containing protein [unclassified Pseudarthrobacter]MDI3196220.1 cupredoxin domain-containing protein [Pseudarthrobacter sp. AL20]MDI3210289.1 cupredoxin domain-containing protein [Pseudarthrobacter sp. AL07]